MAKNTLKGGTYERLLRDVRDILDEARERAERVASQELVQAYWHVGERIQKERLTDNAGYGAAVVENLADDLGMNPRTLQRALTLRKTYKRLPTATLSWAHYRELLRLKNPAARALAEQSAVDQGLTSKALQRAISDGRFASAGKSAKAVSKATKLKRPKQASYLYKASVHRVVDADTLVLDVDLGFEVIKRQRMRLAQIDAPDRKATAGRAARDFVLNELGATDFVVVQTDRLDVHGRYVAHVFYTDTASSARSAAAIYNAFETGHYLSQRLIDQGHARPMP